MDIKIAREVAARIWCDLEMSSVVMDVKLAEEIAQLLASRPTTRAEGLLIPERQPAQESEKQWKKLSFEKWYASFSSDANVLTKKGWSASSFEAGWKSAQQSVQADGFYCDCNLSEVGTITDHRGVYCAGCDRPRR